MSTEEFTTEAIEDLLKQKKSVEVPEDLLGKLIEEIPETIELHPEVSGEFRRRTPLYRRPWALVAAAVFAVAITGSLSWEVYRHSIQDLKGSILLEKPTATSVAQEEPEQPELQQVLKERPAEALDTEGPAPSAESTAVQGRTRPKELTSPPRA